MRFKKSLSIVLTLFCVSSMTMKCSAGNGMRGANVQFRLTDLGITYTAQELFNKLSSYDLNRPPKRDEFETKEAYNIRLSNWNREKKSHLLGSYNVMFPPEALKAIEYNIDEEIFKMEVRKPLIFRPDRILPHNVPQIVERWQVLIRISNRTPYQVADMSCGDDAYKYATLGVRPFYAKMPVDEAKKVRKKSSLINGHIYGAKIKKCDNHNMHTLYVLINDRKKSPKMILTFQDYRWATEWSQQDFP